MSKHANKEATAFAAALRKGFEQCCQAGRITAERIEALLAASEIDVCTKFGKVTIVTVRLPSGFVLVEASGSVDPANYDEEIGRLNCLSKIQHKLWELEGYRLSCANQ